MRWHVRAYCEKNRDYRDFVLSRFRREPEVLDESGHGREGDEGWSTELAVVNKPDPRLKPAQTAIIEIDYGMQDGQQPTQHSIPAWVSSPPVSRPLEPARYRTPRAGPRRPPPAR